MKNTIKRKDHVGRNNVLNLRYFDGFFLLTHGKNYLNMNIHEKIVVRTSYCGKIFPSICIMDLLKFEKEIANEKANHN